MNTTKPSYVAAPLLAVAVVCITATSAHAVASCKVKVDKHNGVILVDATSVDGPLLWGSTAGQETNPMFNAGSCVVSGKAKKCELADPLTLASKTAPGGCTVYLTDGMTPCSAWIPGCSPGARNNTGALIKDTNGAVLGYSGESMGTGAIREDAGLNLRLPVASDGSGFAVGGNLYYTSNDCSGSVLIGPDPGMVRQVYVASDSAGYYGPATGSSQNVQSSMALNAGVNAQPDCDTYLGLGTTFVAPHGCCQTAAFPATLGVALPYNLGAFIPPFRVEIQ